MNVLFMLVVFSFWEINSAASPQDAWCDHCDAFVPLNLTDLDDSTFTPVQNILINSKGIPSIIFVNEGSQDANLMLGYCSDILCDNIQSVALFTADSGAFSAGLVLPDDSILIFSIPSSQTASFQAVRCFNPDCSKHSPPNYQNSQFTVNCQGQGTCTLLSIAAVVTEKGILLALGVQTSFGNSVYLENFDYNSMTFNTSGSVKSVSGSPSSIQGGVSFDGRPFFGFPGNGDYWLIACEDVVCNTTETNFIYESSIANMITYNGLPALLYNDGHLNLIICGNVNCSLTHYVQTVSGQFLGVMFLAVAPSGFLMFGAQSYLTNGLQLTMVQCLDAACDNFVTKLVPVPGMQIQGGAFPTAISPASHKLYGAATTNSTSILLIPFCGSVVESAVTTNAPLQSDASVTVRGSDLCDNQGLSCTIANLTAKAVVVNATTLNCEIPSTITEPGNYTISVNAESGEIGFATAFLFTPTRCKSNCSNHGDCDLLYGNCSCSPGYWREDCSGNLHRGFIASTAVIFTVTLGMGLIVGVIFYRNVPSQRFDAPEHLKKLNVDNVINFLLVPVELVQFTVLGLGLRAEWAAVLYRHTSGFIFEFSPSMMFTAFYIVSALCLLWCLYMLPLLLSYKGTPLIDKFMQVGVFRASFSIAFIILVPLGTFLVMPVTNLLLSLFKCHYDDNSVTGPWLDMDKSVICWQGEYDQSAAVAVVAFIAYYPLALYALPRLQKLSSTKQIFFRPGYLFIEALISVHLVVVQTTLVDHELARIIGTLLLLIILGIANIEMKPCNYEPLNTARTATHLAAGWSCCMSIWATFAPPDTKKPLIGLIIGWCLIGLVLVLVLLGVVRRYREKVTKDLKENLHDASVGEAQTDRSPLLRTSVNPDKE
eukprot:TRINITY_DN3601_c0_g1_i1.p1 TRINITY_DN3601_c0_g1~~TRINITY_DN3601_c0_g1_i1.p1  ORF type:complete len:881 (-),score=141.82 TRINITY_DN3601_c0_g1_i1:25-2667(-)